MPVLALLGASATAQEEIAKQEKVQKNQIVAPCGINDSCLARGCACSMGGAMELDFMYWRAENNSFIYACKDGTESTRLMRLDSQWDPGFRLGMGWNTSFDHWDLFVDWTWFRDHATESNSNTDGFSPLWPMDTGVYQDVSASWHLQYNMFNMELGRAFYITKALSLRPHCGLSGGWIIQRFASKVSHVLVEDDVPDPEMNFHGKNNFWGIGPRVGIHGQWHILNSHWSVLGKAAGDLLLGQTNVHSLSKEESPLLNITDKFSQVVPHVQLFLGIDWGSCFKCDKYYLGLNAGWEVNYYWNQFSLATQPADDVIGIPYPFVNDHALEMSGVTINFHFDY